MDDDTKAKQSISGLFNVAHGFLAACKLVYVLLRKQSRMLQRFCASTANVT
jgi:hypothetical protein